MTFSKFQVLKLWSLRLEKDHTNGLISYRLRLKLMCKPLFPLLCSRSFDVTCVLNKQL